MRVDGIVVISPALHAGDREFEPRSTYLRGAAFQHPQSELVAAPVT